jgi:hypothetical protein
MESLEPQVQDSAVTNGAVEASTGCSPAAPPSAASAPAISDLPRTADQGKDGGQFLVASLQHSPMKHFRSMRCSAYRRQRHCCTRQKIPYGQHQQEILGAEQPLTRS